VAKSRRKRQARRGTWGWIFRGVAILVLSAVGFAAWLWWDMRSWMPDAALYPEQGAVIPAGPAEHNLTTLRAVGAQFVYLQLGASPETGSDSFADRFARARDAGLMVGVILTFDPCKPADPQSAYFTQMVPREGELLSPAIALTRVAPDCDPEVSDAAVESELLTLVNQIELHAEKPVVLKLSREFEARHRIARSVDRDLWLERDRARPDYAGRPWLLWSANSQRVTEAGSEPLEWVVVQR